MSNIRGDTSAARFKLHETIINVISTWSAKRNEINLDYNKIYPTRDKSFLQIQK